MIGLLDEDAALREWGEVLAEAETLTQEGAEVVILAYSDGSKKGSLGSQTGTYGWEIRGVEGGIVRQHIRGGGVVHADPWDISSTVAELDGKLAIHLFLHDCGCGYKVVHRLDNMAVVQGTKGSHAEEYNEDTGSLQTMCWVGFTDPYRWCELQAVTRDMQEAGTQVETMWSKGHPEKYKKRKDWTVHDFMNDRVDKLAETQYGREQPKGQGLTYSHGPSWEIEHRGTVLRGVVYL